MTFEITFLAEADAALPTRIGLFLRVDTLVPSQIVLHAETLAAYVAHVILLTRVHRQVTQHLLSPAESLGAIDALMRELVCMSLAVYVKGRFSLECLAAGVTHVRTLTGMDTPMVLHGGLHSEAAAAYVASVILHAVVHVLQMIIQTTALDELLTADMARVRFLSRVRAYVGPVAFPRGKLFVTELANHRRVIDGCDPLDFELFDILFQTRIRFVHLGDVFSRDVLRFFRATRGRLSSTVGTFVLCIFVFLLVTCEFIRRRCFGKCIYPRR